MKVNVAMQRLLKKFRSTSKVIACLVGPAGIGKSAIVKVASKEAGFDRFVDLRLATQEAGDLVGFPKTKGDFTYWTIPSWWPLRAGQTSPITGQTLERDEKVVVFLDELNRAPQDVRQCVFQLLTEYKMHTHELPEGCKIVVAINPADGQYQVEELDKAMNSRMQMLHISTDLEQFSTWGKQNGIYEKILNFLQVHPELVAPEKAGADGKSFPCPRTWAFLSEEYTSGALAHGDEDEFECIDGLVGKEAAAAFVRFLKENYKKFVTAKEIFAKYDDVKERFLAQRDDETHATLSDIVSTLNANDAKTGKKVDDMYKTLAKLIHDIAKGDYKVAIVEKMSSKQRQKLVAADPTMVDVISTVIDGSKK